MSVRVASHARPSSLVISVETERNALPRPIHALMMPSMPSRAVVPLALACARIRRLAVARLSPASHSSISFAISSSVYSITSAVAAVTPPRFSMLYSTVSNWGVPRMGYAAASATVAKPVPPVRLRRVLRPLLAVTVFTVTSSSREGTSPRRA